ncbi:MAG TPA: sensor histidine kinase [Anaerolineae bacterium]|nr:sensor histidine kinase [Anaerolineae bacterium]
MNEKGPEPGFVQSYRLFVAVRILFWIVIGPILVVVELAANPELTAEQVSAVPLVQRFTMPNVAPALALDALLLALLVIPQVRRTLGSGFVPLTFLAGLVPLLAGYYWWPSENPLQSPFSMFFFVMLVLIAWQYGYRYVLLFVFALSAYQSLLYMVLVNMLWTAWFGWLLLQGAMMLLVGYVVATFVTVQREQRRALAEAYEQQAHIARRLQRHAATVEELAISRERNRLARELHDTLAHSLSAVTVQLEAARSLWDTSAEKARRMMEQADDTARTGLTEARRALQDLRASPLADLGLALAVEELAETAAQRTGAGLDLHIDAKLAEGLSDAVEQGVYRIAQEMLDNVVRHAGATSIGVWLEERDEQLELRVEDDGQGIDVSAAGAAAASDGQRLGIRGMRERAALIGGTLDITSKPNLGTRVSLSIPL